MEDTIIDILLEYADSNEKIHISQVEKIAKDIQSLIEQREKDKITLTADYDNPDLIVINGKRN